MIVIPLIILGLLLLGMLGYWLALKQRHIDLWIGSYYFPAARKEQPMQSDEPIELFIAICDHYEPGRDGVAKQVGIALVDRWVNEYPALFDQFRDCNGRVPQHTFFFPQDEYEPEYLDRLKVLCEAGYGDVDVHLHHEADTAEQLRDKLNEFRETLYHRHGLLRRDPQTNEIVYGFIHGNWALCNSRPDGLCCGVNEEITILRETGCYADFTMPSAPSNTQTSTINSIYYATNRPGEPKSHDTGQPAVLGKEPPAESLLMIQGPLVPNWSPPKWGVFPRIENGDLHGTRPPTIDRLQLWIKANVHVQGKPNWKFIKLHTHGCKHGNIDMLLGEQMQQFHQQLARYAQNNQSVRYHYVTAWEMALLVRQLEQNEPDLSKVLSARSACRDTTSVTR